MELIASIFILIATGVPDSHGPIPVAMLPTLERCQETIASMKLKPELKDQVHFHCIEYQPKGI